MNGKKRKNKKLVLDSGKVNHFLRSDLAPNYFNMKVFLLLKFNIYNFTFFRKKLKRNESQKENSFQI